MKLLIILLIDGFILYFYNEIFNNGALGLIVIIFSFLAMKSKFKLDRRYKEFLNIVSSVEFNSLEEAIEEFKESKKYLKKVFKDENSLVLDQFLKLKYTRKEYNRFIDLQQQKIKFIEEQLYKRSQYFFLSCLINLLSFFPFALIKFNNPYFFYQLYNGGYVLIFIFSIIFIVSNNILLLYSNRKCEKVTFLDHYSLCFHKNCLSILDIKDDNLVFDSKGLIEESEYKIRDKNISNILYVPIIISIISSIFIYLR